MNILDSNDPVIALASKTDHTPLALFTFCLGTHLEAHEQFQVWRTTGKLSWEMREFCNDELDHISNVRIQQARAAA